MQPHAHQSPPHRVRRRVDRGAIRALVGCVLAALLINTWIVKGLFVPMVVQGGSMAPGLLGAHRDWRCTTCGADFACNLESLPAAERAATCPHCGAANDSNRAVDVSGDRVLVDCSAFLWRPPRRWETVVVRSPDDPDLLCVKRVVGLPGEAIEIVDGEVLVNGTLARKDLDALRALAVNVSGTEVNDRWHVEDASWNLENGWFVHHEHAGDSIDWLTYHHREPVVVGTRGADQPILDGSAFDQNESRRLNAVDDVMLRCEVETSGSAEIHLRVAHRGDDFVIRLDAKASELKLAHNGRTTRRVAVADLPKLLAGLTQVELVVADRRVQFALGGKLLVRYDYQPGAAKSVGQPGLALGVKSGPIRVRKLEVLRDVYYTPAVGVAAVQYRLGKQEYFLLGDNSPHSLDSRVWSSRGGVSSGLLLGPALAWSPRTR